MRAATRPGIREQSKVKRPSDRVRGQLLASEQVPSSKPCLPPASARRSARATRPSDPADRRSALIILTPKALGKLPAVERAETNAAALSALTPTERTQLFALLTKVICDTRGVAFPGDALTGAAWRRARLVAPGARVPQPWGKPRGPALTLFGALFPANNIESLLVTGTSKLGLAGLGGRG